MTSKASAPSNPKSDVLKPRFDTLLERFEARLEQTLPDPAQSPQRLHQAMHYAVVGGGKRIRPLLAYASSLALDMPVERADAIAIAVELIHAYSLIHDDLPAMDDDDLRRGRPSCHRAFDEATAILAGDALQALAFQVLAENHELAHTPDAQLKVIEGLARACGAAGMAGGQALDLEATGSEPGSAELEAIHRLKTGALIRFATTAPAWASRAEAAKIVALDRFGSLIGLAFQVHDDWLDENADTMRLGKPSGSDQQQNKSTFVSLLGEKACRDLACSLCEQAISSLEPLGSGSGNLAVLARYAVEREY